VAEQDAWRHVRRIILDNSPQMERHMRNQNQPDILLPRRLHSRLRPSWPTKMPLTMPLDRAAVDKPKRAAPVSGHLPRIMSAENESKAKPLSEYTAE